MEKHYHSSLRIHVPEVLEVQPGPRPRCQSASPGCSRWINGGKTIARFQDNHFEITEDTMPGELANVHAGRVANLLNLRG